MRLPSNKTFTGAGLFSAFAASLCCISPVIALLAGSSSLAANFFWIEPARPYLIALSIIVLMFAWYQKLKPVVTPADCKCEYTKKSTFFQSKTFLSIVTVFAVLMIAFPLYAKIFYSKPTIQTAPVAVSNNKVQASFSIEGMTCEACEDHVNNELSKVAGVINYKTSYADNNSVISFDTSVVNIKMIEAAINKTGYTTKNYKLLYKNK